MDAYLPFCRYYHGEHECPYEFDDRVNYTFWMLEKMYLEQSDDLRENYNGIAQEYIETNSDVINFMTSNAPIEQKGFVMFAEQMLDKWSPDEVDLIFKYDGRRN